MPFSRKKITGVEYYLLRDKIKVGDALLTTTRGEFSNLINPEKIKHGAIYVGDIEGSGVCYVVEAVGKGVRKTDLVTFITTKDLIINCRAKFVEDADKVELMNNAKKIIGIPYDYLFDKKTSKALYCFEAIAYVLKSVHPDIQLKCKQVVKGKSIYSYETYLDNKNFDVIFNSNEI